MNDWQALSAKIEPFRLIVAGKERLFDICDPVLPRWITDQTLEASEETRMPRKAYKSQLRALQIELVKLQYWLQSSGERIIAVFEGRDAAGKGGCISRLRAHLNPRTARNVALPKPNDVERGQWYFQRYIRHFPTSGELVTFDRSWYNRAVVEPVMGFCTPEESRKFIKAVPEFEHAIVDEGIHLFKFWLNISQETQLLRFHERFHHPLKRWKFSEVDMQGIVKWDDYTAARDHMVEATHTPHGPWTIVQADDQRRARIAAIRHILLSLPYHGRDMDSVGTEDPNIIGSGPEFLR